MTADGNEVQVVEDVPKARSGVLPLIILSVLLGVVVIAGVVGAILSYQSTKALRAELLVMKKEIEAIKEMSLPKEDSPALEAALKDMKHQIETLSAQINVLMASVSEHASPEAPTAKSEEVGGKTAAPVPSEAAGQAQQGKKQSSESPASAKSASASKKPDVRSCDLIGKSPEEQAATLKRCVSLIDPPEEKRAP